MNNTQCHEISKRLHHLRTDGIRSKQVSATSSGEKMATSDVRAEQHSLYNFVLSPEIHHSILLTK